MHRRLSTSTDRLIRAWERALLVTLIIGAGVWGGLAVILIARVTG